MNEFRYDLELHVVHESLNSNAKYAVVSHLYEIGPPDAFLSKVTNNYKFQELTIYIVAKSIVLVWEKGDINRILN